MAEDFNYSASVSADMGDFIQSMKDAHDMAEKLSAAGEQLDTVLGKDLEQGIRQLLPVGKSLEQAFAAGGNQALAAAKDIKAYTASIEQATRAGADYLSGSSLGSRMGLRTSAEKEQDRQSIEADKAHKESIKQRIEQERRFVQEVKEFAKDYRDSQLGSIKEVTDATVRSAQRRIDALKDGQEVDSRAAQDSAINNILSAKKSEEAHQRAADAQLAHLEVFRTGKQTVQDVQREYEKYLNTVSNTRYALYDVATTMTVISGATLGLTSAGVGLAASYERSFADVARVSGGTQEQVESLRQELLQLSTTVPEAYSEVAKVATLGGQMNVPVQALSKFTDTVLMFSSATGVSVEQAAAKMGRLSQMTGTAASELENLGSAVYFVGINSVATEADILNVAEQISATANLAGFANHEIVGLASAMASLGIAPQMARGATLRVFRNIADAVDEAGEELDKFSAVAGTSAENFTRAWKERPAEAFQLLLEGMGRVADSGGNLNTVLQDLGITQTQDSQVMLMLAQNTEVYAGALANAAKSYAEGTALQEGFAITASTLVERLKTLWNTFKGTVSEGMRPFLAIVGLLLKPIEAISDLMSKVVQNPFGRFFVSATAAVMGLVGSAALLIAVGSRLSGSFFGILRSAADMNAALRKTTAGVSQVGRAVAITKAEVDRSIGSIRAYATAWAQLNLSKAGITERIRSVDSAYGNLGRTLVKSVGYMAAVTLAAQGLMWAWDKFSGAAQQRHLDDMFGGSNLQEAIAKDTAALEEGGEAYHTFVKEVEVATEFTPKWVATLERSADAQGTLKDSVKETSEAIEEQITVMGEHYRRGLLEGLTRDGGNVQEAFKDYGAIFEEMGLSLATAVDEALASGGQGGGAAYMDGFVQAALVEAQEMAAVAHAMSEEFGMASEEYFNAVDAEAKAWNVWNALKQIRDEMSNTDLQIVSDEAMAKANEFMATSADMVYVAEDAAEAYSKAEAEVRNFADSLFDIVLNQADTTEALWNLIDGLANTDEAFNMTSEAGVQNMRNLEAAVRQASDSANGDAEAYIGNLLDIYTALEMVGVEGSAEIDFLGQHLAAVFGEEWGLALNVNPARASAQAVLADMIAVLQAKAEIESRAFVPIPTSSAHWGKGIGTPDDAVNTYKQIDALKALQEQLGKNAQAAVDYGNSTEKMRKQAERKSGGGGGGTPKKGGGADAREVRTFADYAAELNEVFRRATEIRYGLINAQDAVSDSIQRMKERFEAAEKAIRDTRTTIRGLQADIGSLDADKAKLEFHLAVATDYGDTARATQIQAELAKVEADRAAKADSLADAQKDLQKAQEDNSKSLVGNSEGARRNRAEVQALSQAYVEEILAMASAGASTQDLQKKTQELKADFEKQVTQMGFNRSEVSKYSKSFEDLGKVIRTVPQNVTVTANTNPAEQAINEWIAKVKKKQATISASVSMPKSLGSIGGGTFSPSSIYSTGPLSTSKVISRNASQLIIGGGGGGTKGTMQMIAKGGLAGLGGEPIYRASGGPAEWAKMYAKGTDTVPAMLTPGEYVLPKRAVDYYGLPFMNALRTMKMPRSGFGGSSGNITVNTSSGPLSLSAGTLQALADILQTHIVIGNREIQQANSAANKRAAVVGAY